VVENTFGVLAISRVHRPLHCQSTKRWCHFQSHVGVAELPGKAIGVQYIYKQAADCLDTSGRFHPGKWRNVSERNRQLAPLRKANTTRANKIKKQVKCYSSSDFRSVSWQKKDGWPYSMNVRDRKLIVDISVLTFCNVPTVKNEQQWELWKQWSCLLSSTMLKCQFRYFQLLFW